MTERHHGQMTLRTTGVSGRRRVGADGESDGTEWRQARNGVPEPVPYARRDSTARDAEVAALVAAARAEALRRARERLGPGPLERQASDRRWEPCGEEGEPA